MSRILGYNDILRVISARPPLLMVDRIELAEDGTSAKATKCVSMDEQFFQGHFPGGPIMPGVLQIAAMYQTACALIREEHLDASDARFPRLCSMNRIKFRKPVFPGDLLQLEVAIPPCDGGFSVKAKGEVDGQTVSQGNLGIEVVDSDDACICPDALVAPPKYFADAKPETVMGTLGVMQIIPHRYPFLLIDKVIKISDDLTGPGPHLVGLKNVTGNEPFMRSMTPPALPGYLQVEAAAQAACVTALSKPGNEDLIGYFMSIDSASFEHPIVPGDQLVMEMILTDRGRFGIAEGTLFVGGRRVSHSVLKFALVEREQETE
ncbi:MAG: hypothetical protein HON70_26665 [Lentisphaerae bacterium]|nr:hypothetical protein [Lentisphaerota bacterium]